jgi:hypothetical protein
MPLLKGHLLIHVDCTHMRMSFRNELFMASRDRLKGADEMHPLVTGEQLEAIYINMDSHVLKTHKGRIKSITEEQIKLADKKYISSVYFHTLFLFATARSKNFSMKQDDKDRDIGEFLREIFSTSYSEFLLNFGTEQLMASLDV